MAPPLYRETIAEAILLIVISFCLVTIPVYFNLRLFSLHIIGPDWDNEITVFGMSMQPVLNDGDSVCIKKIDSSLINRSLNKGDIIAFHRPNSSVSPPIVIHRVIDKVENGGRFYFKTKGDANDASDFWTDCRGEDYTWNGMVSELLLIGKVMGVKKDYAVNVSVSVMSVLLATVFVVDATYFTLLIRKGKVLKGQKTAAS